MRQVSDSLAAAIEAPDRVARPVLLVDWDGDGYGPAGSIDDLSDKIGAPAILDRTLQTDLPDEVQLVDGSAVAQMTASLVVGDSTDEELEAIRYWSRFNTTSPMAGRERMNRDVALDLEFQTADGPQRVPRLRGVTRALPVDVGTRSAQLVALDGRQRLRSRLSLPAVIAEAPPATAFPTDNIQAPGLESTWVASYACSQNGLYSSPPPRPGCRAWVPCHGSVFPMLADMVLGVGQADYTDGGGGTRHRAVRFQPGPFLLGTETVADGGQVFFDLTTTRNDSAHRIVNADGTYQLRVEFWAITVPYGGNPPIEVELTNTAHSGDISQLNFRLSTSNNFRFDMTSVANGSITTVQGPLPVQDGGWHFYGIYVDSAAGTAIFRVDQISTTVAFTPVAPVPWTSADEAYDVFVWVQPGSALAELQVSGGGTSADLWINQIPWTRGAVIDRGYPLQGIADTSPQDSWQILTDLQAAVCGTTWYDDDGILQVAMPGRLVTPQAQQVQRTLTSLADIVDLAYDDQATSVRNRILVPYAPITVHVAETMWSAPAAIYLPSGVTTDLYVEFSGPFVTAPTLNISANTKPDGSGADVSAWVHVGNTGSSPGTFPTAQTAIYSLVNTWSAPVWLVDTSGSPAVTAVGDWIEQTSGAVPPELSDVRPGQLEQTLQVTSNPWIQDRSVALGVAMALLCNLRDGQQVLTKLQVPLDPRLQFYDLVTVEDQHGTGLDDTWWITGLTEDYASMLASLSARRAQARYLAGTGLVGIDIVG